MIDQREMMAPREWFERNPKKTFFLVFIIFFLGLMISAEIFLSIKNGHNSYTLKRSIRLREIEPLTRQLAAPPPDYLKTCDSLVDKPYLVRVDENGFIMPAKIHENPDLVMAFLGGSTTECYYVDEENRFPYLVGRILEKETGLKVNSYNSGISGNNTFHAINILLNKVLSLKPNIVVMMENANDLSVLLYEKVYWNKNPFRSNIIEERNPPSTATSLKNILKDIKDITFPNVYKAFSVNLLPKLGLTKQVDEFEKVRGKKISINKPYLLKEFKSNLQTFIDICRARKIMPVLMTQAERFSNKSTHTLSPAVDFVDYSELFSLFNEAIRDTGKLNHVMVIDLEQKVPKDKKYIYDDFHYNDEGSKFVANIISGELKPLVTPLPSKIKGD